MSKLEFDFNSITGNKDVDQARALRIVLAILEDDVTHIAGVSEEVALDPRGMMLALWELVVGMSGAVAGEWAGKVGAADAADGIRKTLLSNEGSKTNV